MGELGLNVIDELPEMIGWMKREESSAFAYSTKYKKNGSCHK